MVKLITTGRFSACTDRHGASCHFLSGPFSAIPNWLPIFLLGNTHRVGNPAQMPFLDSLRVNYALDEILADALIVWLLDPKITLRMARTIAYDNMG